MYRSTPTPTQSFPSGIISLHVPQNSVVDIVFIHGLTGDRENTWRAANSSDPWPKTLLSPIIPNARILAFGYDAYVTDWKTMLSQNKLGCHSWNLLTSLATHREADNTNDRPIIFVCHSLGGLVCEYALTISARRSDEHLKRISNYTRGIAFLGTPHHASGLVQWAEKLAYVVGVLKQVNKDILKVLRDDSEVLAMIQDTFHHLVQTRVQNGLPPIAITCFFEELPLRVVGVVVPSHSAILPGYIPIGIHEDHIGMTKFDSHTNTGFTAVAGELLRWMRESS
jgi:hypothetical protein